MLRLLLLFVTLEGVAWCRCCRLSVSLQSSSSQSLSMSLTSLLVSASSVTSDQGSIFCIMNITDYGWVEKTILILKKLIRDLRYMFPPELNLSLIILVSFCSWCHFLQNIPPASDTMDTGGAARAGAGRGGSRSRMELGGSQLSLSCLPCQGRQSNNHETCERFLFH